jgi:hypothetical protein
LTRNSGFGDALCVSTQSPLLSAFTRERQRRPATNECCFAWKAAF